MSQQPPIPPTSTTASPEETSNPAPPGSGNPLRWIALYTRGLIYNQRTRRLTMFYAVLAALLMAFIGDVFLSDWLRGREHWQRFVVYWLICGWLTILAALLAVYDLLLLRVQHRLLRRQMREQMLKRGDASKE